MKDQINQTPTSTSTSTAQQWEVLASKMATETFNPIRTILETMKITPNPDKPMISLSIGDPTVFKNLNVSPVVVDAVKDALLSGEYNGYAPSSGYVASRQAVADHISCGTNDITPDDVIICSGCSCSLDMCISALGNPGDNILVPSPGFPLYKTLANGLGIQTKEYNLLPEKNWQVDLKHMEALIDKDTKAILINNPSNPCGSVFDEAHLLEILDIAERHRLPIIADEIYEHFVFSGAQKKYVPIASLTKTVPVLSCGGLTKRYLVPGWRLGWITIHDRNDIFKNGGVRHGLNSLSQRIIGANTIVQGALPTILKETPASFFKDTLDVIEENAKIAYERLAAIPGLNPVMPDGAMYMMVGMDSNGFPAFDNCLQVVEAMVKEQSVFCLPGRCFNIKNFFRVVLTVPKEMMIEACDRISEFCYMHNPSSGKVQQMYNHPRASSEASSSDMHFSSASSVVSSGDDLDDDVDYPAVANGGGGAKQEGLAA